jgi:hypothetical protein
MLGAGRQAAAVAGGVAMGICGMSLVALPFQHAMRVATEWRWWVGGIRFGAARAVSTLRTGALVGTYWSLIGMMTLVTTVFGMIGGVIAGVFYATVLAPAGADGVAAALGQFPIAIGVCYVVWYLGMAVSLGVVTRIYLLQRVWVRVARSCAVVGIEAADCVTAAGEAASALGEGLADGLDFAGF